MAMSPRAPSTSVPFLLRARAWWRWLGGRRHPLVVVLGSIVIAAGTGFGLAAIAGDGRVLGVFGRINPIWFVVCFFAQAIAYLGYVVALRETAGVDGGPTLSYRFASRVVAAGFGAFFSASAAGGFEVDYWALRHSGATRREAMRRVLGLGTLEYAVLAPAALGSALALLAGAGHDPYEAMTVPWLLVIPGFAVAWWLTSPVRGERLSHLDGNQAKRTFAHAVSGLVVLRSLVVQPRAHGLAFVGAALYWSGEILCLWASLRAFHASVQLPALVLAYATGYVATRRALPAGGVGVAELALTFALTWLGVPLAPALLGVFSYRIFNFWLALLPAFAAKATVRRIRETLPETDRELDQAA